MKRAKRTGTPSRSGHKSPSLKCLDLFAGAGGLSVGLEMAGFEVIYANEISPAYSETLQRNHPDTFVSVDDIQNVAVDKVRRSLVLQKGELDLLAGGPPCQGFSINAPKRSTEDRRNHLFWDYLRFVEEFQPKVVLIENVPGMVSFNGGETVNAIVDSLAALGYQATVKILYAPHYGVPQMRWRTVFLATRLGFDPLTLFPAPTHSATGRSNFTTRLNGLSLLLNGKAKPQSGLLEKTTVGDAISDLPAITNGGGADSTAYLSEAHSDYQETLRQGSTSILNHRCAGLGAVNLARLPHIPMGGSWRDIPHDLLPEGMKRARKSDHTKRYGRLDPEGIASTILTKCDPHWGSYIHPTQDRVISVREAARIQSFPDRIRFYGNLTDQYKQVGNAVPPLLAKNVGDRIAECLSGHAKGQKLVPYALMLEPQLGFFD
jgi:DNA (cytosine-5)-methyltransferase 1